MAAAQLAAAPEQQPAAPHARVLLVTGCDYPGHHWKETAPALRKVLEQDKRLEVRIVDDPEFLSTPVIDDYDVIFLHFKNYQPFRREKEVRANLANFVKGGKGLVLLHYACGAFDGWPEFADLAGKIYDKNYEKNGHAPHDPRQRFTVHIAQPEHPIVRGLRDFEADDELYICLIGDRPVEVLATAHSKLTGKNEPMAFVLEYGKGRVFHTPLGHDCRAIEMPGVAELLRRGCLWAAKIGP
jgi:type 1 glutamine amidotransferase